MSDAPNTYVVHVGRKTRRRLEKARDQRPRPDDPSSRLGRIFGEAYEQVLPPGSGWTTWQSTSDVDLGADDYIQIDIPAGMPLARARSSVLFEDGPLEYQLLRPPYADPNDIGDADSR